MITCKEYNEQTAADFRALFYARFPDGDPSVMEMMLTNPLRRAGDAMGAIAYDEQGRPIAIQGIARRRAFLGQHEVCVGQLVAMAVAKDVDRSFFTPFLKETMEGFGADLIFGNTSIPGSRRRLQAAIEVKDGPQSYAAIREWPLRGNSLPARMMRKVLKGLGFDVGQHMPAGTIELRKTGEVAFRRLPVLDDSILDAFWHRYLKTNRGLVGSHTATELRWMFAKDMEKGEVELVAVFRSGELLGYVFLKRTDASATCWRLVDALVLGNDLGVLESLIRQAAAFLKRFTPALYFQVTGCPSAMEPVVRRLFPSCIDVGFNRCISKCMSPEAEKTLGNWHTDPDSWYGTPFDGDMAML